MAAILPPNDERIRKFLRQAGVDENSPVDPVSRDALLELLLHNDDETNNNKGSVASAIPDPLPASVLNDHPTATMPEHSTENNNPPMSQTLGVQPEAANIISLEDRMLQMMQQQNQMILDLHKRMDYLTELVGQQNHHQQQKRNPTETPREELNRQIDELFAQVQLYERNAAEHAWKSPTSHPSNSTTPPQQRRSFVSQKRHQIHQIAQIFFAFRRRLAPNFDAGLILKVLFILAILINRLSRKQQSIDDEEWDFFRFYLLVLFVVSGFLYQTGMLKVIYIFYVQENYFQFLWKGDELGDIEQEVNAALERYSQWTWPRPPPRGDDAGQELQPENPPLGPEQPQPGWRDTFIGGVIQPVRHANEQDRGFQFLRDIGLFVGSFFLSILPMWRPAALVVPEHVHNNVGDGADDTNGLPEVATPADVLQVAEDEDEDENNEEGKTD